MNVSNQIWLLGYNDHENLKRFIELARILSFFMTGVGMGVGGGEGQPLIMILILTKDLYFMAAGFLFDYESDESGKKKKKKKSFWT